MTIFLHIGSHKTGTTAIQNYLARHRDPLCQQGIWYPKDSDLLEGGRNSSNHLNIARSLDCTGKPKAYNKDQLQTMVAALVTKARDYDTTILSAEAFWRIGFGRHSPDGDNSILWQRKQANVAAIRELFGGQVDVRVVAVLRERMAYLQSSYSEFILATYYQNPIHQYLNYIRHIMDYRRQLESWEREFPVCAFSYEQLCSTRDLPTSFLKALIGAFLTPQGESDQQHLHNVGHPIPCVVFKRYLNGVSGLSHERLLKLYKQARRRFLKGKQKNKSVINQLQTINSWLTAEEIRTLRCRFSAEDEAIRSRFCPQFLSGPTTKDPERDGSVIPLTLEAESLTLNWMLKRIAPQPAWFTIPAAQRA